MRILQNSPLLCSLWEHHDQKSPPQLGSECSGFDLCQHSWVELLSSQRQFWTWLYGPRHYFCLGRHSWSHIREFDFFRFLNSPSKFSRQTFKSLAIEFFALFANSKSLAEPNSDHHFKCSTTRACIGSLSCTSRAPVPRVFSSKTVLLARALGRLDYICGRN